MGREGEKKNSLVIQMIEPDKIYNIDCMDGLRQIADKTIDLVVTDPPYILENQGGGFWSKSKEGNHYNSRGTRKGMDKLIYIKDGFDDVVLDEMCRVMKKINIYIFCSQKQIQRYLEYFVDGKKCNWNLMSWHKTNPIPACGNKYLNDTEYIMFFREKGVRLYGSYETKKTYYTSLRNQEDNTRYKHPTVKPLNIIRNLITNSSVEGDLILDPFIGTGTTAVAACQTNRHFIGFEIDKNHYETSLARIKEQQLNLF